jgi:hypothetical protein
MADKTDQVQSWPTNGSYTLTDGNQRPYTVPDANRVAVDDVLYNNNLGNAADNIDRVQRLSQISPASTAIGSSFYGINHRQTPAPIQINRDYYGLAFFTRPYMNMSTENLETHRKFTPLLTTNDKSLPRIIRCLFDFSLARQGITSPFVDPHQAFIAPLTNHLLSMAGWPDISAQTFSSHEGLYKEGYSFVDGNIAEDFQLYDITATFRNLPGDPITTFFYYWTRYMAAVFEGLLVPYPGMIFNNEIDYQTRIYRVVLDSTKTKVQKIAATGASFPLNSPTGAAFNFESREGPLNSSNDQITINFRCMGAQYLDDILIDEFNRTVQLFNPLMTDDVRGAHYTKVPMWALSIFNNTGYARIDPETYELQWWVDNDQYQYYLPAIQQKQQLNDQLQQLTPTP